MQANQLTINETVEYKSNRYQMFHPYLYDENITDAL